MSTPKPSTWVFDLDGTLVDSFETYFATLGEIFHARGMLFNDSLHLAALTQPLPLFLQRHLGRPAVESAMTELQERSNEDARRIRPFPGILEMIQVLSQSGARVAVWTNRDLVSADLILRHSGLSPYVEICISGTCVTDRKPHPEGLLRIMKELGSLPPSVTMVGDHEHDVLGAKSANTRAVRASWHAYWPVEKCSEAHHQFHDVAEFSRWIIRDIQR